MEVNGKYFVDPKQFLLDSYILGKKILESDFRPNFIVGLWRGGAPPGIAVQEFLKYKKIETDHISIRTSAYHEDKLDVMKREIQVDGLDYIIRKINYNDKLLLVDDVYDSGLSMEAVLKKLSEEARANTPNEIKIATVYYKPLRNKTTRRPDFYVHETDQWLIFPHELNGLDLKEIEEGKGKEIVELLK